MYLQLEYTVWFVPLWDRGRLGFGPRPFPAGLGAVCAGSFPYFSVTRLCCPLPATPHDTRSPSGTSLCTQRCHACRDRPAAGESDHLMHVVGFWQLDPARCRLDAAAHSRASGCSCHCPPPCVPEMAHPAGAATRSICNSFVLPAQYSLHSSTAPKLKYLLPVCGCRLLLLWAHTQQTSPRTLRSPRL